MSKTATLPFCLDPLDTRFVPPKPKNSVDDSRVLELEKQGQAVYTRKRDGHYVSGVITDRARLYTRGEVKDITENFPHIAEELSKLPLPKGGTLLCCELTAEERGRDSRESVNRLTKSKPDQALRLQKEHGFARLMVFNILILGGKDISHLPNGERLALVRSKITGASFVFPVEMLDCSFTEAQKRVRKEKWEGVVVYDKNMPTFYRLDGNEDRPPRPDGCWKRKPSYEDDFIAYGWERGAEGKRHADRMGKLLLAQVHPDTGARISCGEVGIGFSDKDREFFAHDSLYPCVVQIEYERRFPPKKISGGHFQCALSIPKYVRIRDDKKPNGCVLPQNLAREFAKKEGKEIRHA